MGQCVEDVDDRRDARRDRNTRAGQPMRIALAVPPLVVMACDLLRNVHLRDVRFRQQFGASKRVLLHDLPLAVRQAARLEQDRIRHSNLTDIMQQRRDLEDIGLAR